MKIDILRNRFERNKINDEWLYKEANKNRSYDMNWKRGYIWTNIDGENNLYNKKDIFTIVLSKDMIDKFNIKFAYSKNENINIIYNEDNNELSFE
ncbi:hypothetical protein, partial [Clostridium sp. HCS.1]|uniref:hypothetical protein n=1 Tax=Clostridium sp. HCS.1 TaxID=3238594 RepID=UPI003A0FDB78